MSERRSNSGWGNNSGLQSGQWGNSKTQRSLFPEKKEMTLERFASLENKEKRKALLPSPGCTVIENDMPSYGTYSNQYFLFSHYYLQVPHPIGYNKDDQNIILPDDGIVCGFKKEDEKTKKLFEAAIVSAPGNFGIQVPGRTGVSYCCSFASNTPFLNYLNYLLKRERT